MNVKKNKTMVNIADATFALPTINSYMCGNAMAIAHIAAMKAKHRETYREHSKHNRF
jgi:hypothetical protein